MQTRTAPRNRRGIRGNNPQSPLAGRLIHKRSLKTGTRQAMEIENRAAEGIAEFGIAKEPAVLQPICPPGCRSHGFAYQDL
ncbi:MAG: hypothetical protein P8Y63_14820 [Deltaproteobacteria bacterium]